MTIAKISGRKKSQGGDYAGNGFKGLAMYMLNPKQDNPAERVGMAYALNFGEHTEHMRLDDAAGIMRNTAEQHRNKGHRVAKPVWHFQINFHPSDTDKLTPEMMREYVSEHMAAIGLQEHQMLVVEHVDTDHRHLHIMVNRVHPVTGKAARDRIFNPALSECAQRLDQAHGLYNKFNRLHENPRERTGYNRAADEIAQRNNDPRPMKDPEQVKALRGLVGDDFRSATSWQELDETLAAKGVHLQPHRYRGRDYIRVMQGEQYVSISKIGHDIKQEGLEQRLGNFADHAAQRDPNALETGLQATQEATATLTQAERLAAFEKAIDARQRFDNAARAQEGAQSRLEHAEAERDSLTAEAADIADMLKHAEQETFADINGLLKPDEAAAYFKHFKDAISSYRSTAQKLENADASLFAKSDHDAMAAFKGRLKKRKRAQLQKIFASRKRWLAAIDREKAHKLATEMNRDRRNELIAQTGKGIRLDPFKRKQLTQHREATGLLVSFDDLKALPAERRDRARSALVQDNLNRKTDRDRQGHDWTTSDQQTPDRDAAAKADYAAFLEAAGKNEQQVSFEQYQAQARSTAEENAQTFEQTRARGRSLGRG